MIMYLKLREHIKDPIIVGYNKFCSLQAFVFKGLLYTRIFKVHVGP